MATKSKTVPPIPAMVDDVTLVKTLEIPAFDKTREFQGISKLKVSRKDKHMKALDAFASLLDQIAEQVEIDLLRISRDMRGKLEDMDTVLLQDFRDLDDATYLIIRDECDLFANLEVLKGKVRTRADVIEQFAVDLDGLETQRAQTVGDELKKLVDTLVAIAHQLRDEIEHIVESETFDLNSVLTKNRQAHAQLLGLLRKRQIEVEVEVLQRWEDSRRKWRQLRHNKAVKDFNIDIRSQRFVEPTDRQAYLKTFRDGQEDRQRMRLALMDRFAQFTADNIASADITPLQQSYTTIAESELSALQTCYNTLTDMRFNLQRIAEERVEAFRKELHLYGALKIEPILTPNILLAHLNDPTLSDLWRLGGGLKQECQSFVNEFVSDELAYETLVGPLEARLDLIVSGFGLKAVLVKNGRASLLDKLRGAVTKLRSLPRGELVGALEGSLMADLEYLVGLQGESAMPATFRNVLTECMQEMAQDIDRVKRALVSPSSGHSSTSRGGTVTGGTGALPPSSSSSVIDNKSKTATLLSSKTGNRTQSSNNNESSSASSSSAIGIDPTLVKNWHRKLAMLFYACDLPQLLQTEISEAYNKMQEKRACNALIDQVVNENVTKPLQRIAERSKRACDAIATFVESQANVLATVATNIGDFYLQIAKTVESHRKQQFALDERTADDLFELDDDFRIEREDREAELERRCQVMRECVGFDELQLSFEQVLETLQEIQDSYRAYHGKACFAADKYPLRLADEFQRWLKEVSEKYFAMTPSQDAHNVVLRYHSLFDECIRLNKAFFEADPASAGVPPRPQDVRKFEELAAQKQAAALALQRQAEAEAAASKPSSKPTSPRKPSSAQNSPRLQQLQQKLENAEKVENVESNEDFGTFVSPNCPKVDSDDESDTENANNDSSDNNTDENKVRKRNQVVEACFGPFNLTKDPKEYYKTFFADGAYSPPDASSEPTSEPANVPEPVNTNDVNDANGSSDSNNVENDSEVVIEMHPDCPFLRKEACHLLWPVDRCVINAFGDTPGPIIDEEDLLEHDTHIAAMFVDVSLTQPSVFDAFDEVTKADFERAKAIRDRILLLTASQQSNTNVVPLDSQKRPFVLSLEFTLASVKSLIDGLRASIVVALEKEAFARLKRAESLTVERKAMFTEELEDRLRTHWPRRGRVETQIKQPREAELLGHQEKTWRLIQACQGRMQDTQNKFFQQVAAGKVECDKFVGEMTALRNALVNETYRSLAVLQGVDVKARTGMLSFQSSCQQTLASLTSIATNDTAAAIAAAQDFRKVCPPQSPGVSDGGYSESELNEIQELMDGQCNEILEVSSSWQATIQSLKEQQEQSLKSHGEFVSKYEKVAQDLAMSEGLGQKYGAPRRRAQERIRTEVSRDEQNAGKVDELLAKLEFVCAEAAVASPNGDITNSVVPETATNSNGRLEFEKVLQTWSLLCQLRLALVRRSQYLDVLLQPIPISSSSATTEPTGNTESIPFVDPERIPAPKQDIDELGPSSSSSSSSSLTGGPYPTQSCPVPIPSMSLHDVFSDVDKSCREETRQLYASEGKSDLLQVPGGTGVPESLETWLLEAKEKILGRHGYRERAWKRLWAQVDRLEVLTNRKKGSNSGLHENEENEDNEEDNEDDEEEEEQGGELDDGRARIAKPRKPKGLDLANVKLGVAGVCFRSLAAALVAFVENECTAKEIQFAKQLKSLESGRDKHERLLRPRLGSPDAVDELNELHAMEKERSTRLTEAVIAHRSEIVVSIATHTKVVFADMAVACSGGLMKVLDSAIRQEKLQLPPDTAVPKKRMTLKRLRKAQRLRKEVADNNSTASFKERVWPGADSVLAGVKTVLKNAEVLVPNLAAYVEPPQPAQPTVAATIDPKKGQKAAPKKDPKAPPEPAVPVEAPSLVPESWVQKLASESALRGQVSTAHRVLLYERDNALGQRYLAYVKGLLEGLRDKYDLVLSQEHSWSERWDRQVDMLRKGTL